MGEFELLQLIETARSQIVILLSQIIAINFAMIVAIYYFLNEAALILKLAAFALYAMGSLAFFFFMLGEVDMLNGAAGQLAAIDQDNLGVAAKRVVASVGGTTSLMLNIFVNFAYGGLWLAVIYLLFFWKKLSTHVA